MEKVYVVQSVRTPVGTFGGSLKDVKAVDLGTLVIDEVLKRAGTDKEEIEEVIMGNVLQGGLGQNPARQAAVNAGIPEEVPAYTVNKVCGSGLKSINLAAQSIMTGEADLVVAGGMENMSQAPYVLPSARWGGRMGDQKLNDLMILDGLWCAFENIHMGVTAENIAEDYGIGRQEQDELALESQEKAINSIDQGAFKDEIVPVEIKPRKKEPYQVDTDEHPRRGTSLDKLSALPPAFKKDGGTVTAGNASGINDGAGALLLASEEKVKKLGLAPVAEICGYASAGVPPRVMGTGPIKAIKKLLDRTGYQINDMDLIELNEAFASQALSVLKELKINREITNVNGGAIALGHPIGASGTRLMVTLLHEMVRRNSRLGLASLCIGGGQGIASLVKRA